MIIFTSTFIGPFFFICVTFANVTNTQIVSGSIAGAGKFPYQVSIKMKIRNMHICGGAIIKKNFIITAAHCYYEKPCVTLFYAVVGTHHINEAGIRIELIQLKLHEQYDSMFIQNDIALLRTVDIPFSELVQPIVLTQNAEIPSGSNVIVSGWGFIREPVDTNEYLYNPARPILLRYIESSTIALDECKRIYNQIKENDADDWKLTVESLKETNICVQNNKMTGVCIGDSGSGLVSNNTLIGLVSWSIGCARGYPDVYTKIYNQLDWIYRNT